MTIWKFPLFKPDETLHMPADARVLSVQAQHGHPCIWAMVSQDAPKIPRRFVVKMTGEEFDPTGLEFVGTVQIEGGALVLHVFQAVHP